MLLEIIFQFDRYLIENITKIHSYFLDPIMIGFTKIGDYGIIWGIIILILLCIKKYRYIGLILFVGLLIDVILGEGILKHLFHRLRPFEQISDINLIISAPITSSFPSGHSSAAWCFAILFWRYFRFNKIFLSSIIWIIAIGVTFSRVYLQVHFPTDILVGMLVGWLSAILAVRSERIIEKISEKLSIIVSRRT